MLLLFVLLFVDFALGSTVSIIDKKDDKPIIDNVVFDINAKYKTLDHQTLIVKLQCDDQRVIESIMEPVEEAFDLLQSIFVYSLPTAKPVPIPQ